MTPETRALLVKVPKSIGQYKLVVGKLDALPYATTDEGIYFDLHDNNQLEWPKAHKASIHLDKCKLFDFFIIKDNPVSPAMSTTTDCAVEWAPVECKPKPAPEQCHDEPRKGCSCKDLGGATCIGCLKTYQVAVHAPAY